VLAAVELPVTDEGESTLRGPCLCSNPQENDTATEASWRSHASGSGDGGGLGGDSSWGTGYGGDVGRVDRQ
jgi:hypothetical protein